MHGRKAHQIVHVGERQHRGFAACAYSGCFQVAVDELQGAGRRQEAGTGIKRDLEAHCRQFARRQVRCAAALDHVRQQCRALEGFSDTAQFLQAFGTLDEEHIGAGIEEPLSPPQGCIHPFGIARVRPGNDEKVAAWPRIDRDTDLGDGVIGRDHTAEFGVTAFLREFLIFKLDAGSARGRIAAHGAIDIQQSAIAGIAVGNEWNADRAGDTAHAVEHLRERRGAGIGDAKSRCDDTISSHVKRVEACTRRHSR